MARIEFELKGLDCVSCALKIEESTKELTGVKKANLDFVSKKIRVDIDNSVDMHIIKKDIIAIVNLNQM